MKTITDIINHLIKRNNYKTYLEIGVRDSRKNFDKIEARYKTGVDPDPLFINEKTKRKTDPIVKHYKITSDEFFKGIVESRSITYDLIFIDDLHEEKQVTKDIQNSLLCLNEGGSIVVHDCNPPTEWHQRSVEEFEQSGKSGDWNGTVWKGFCNFRHRSDLFMRTVDVDWGVGIIQQIPIDSIFLDSDDTKLSSNPIMITAPEMNYKNFSENRSEWLNLISTKDFLATF